MRAAFALGIGLAILPSSAAAQAGTSATFPHERHIGLFPTCTTCHLGITTAGEPRFPSPAACRSCHDGAVRPTVSWEPRATPKAGNLRFTHDAHPSFPLTDAPDDDRIQCSLCHVEFGAPGMAVQRTVIPQCLSCHGQDPTHYSGEPEGCATCHVPLAEAAGLTTEAIRHFPTPSSHADALFALGGHGTLAGSPTGNAAATCATCHARDFCASCHVNAPELPVIQSLGADPRSRVLATTLPTPTSHERPEWLGEHRREAVRDGATCATCHTKESCQTCHVGAPPKPVQRLPGAGPDRGVGASVERRPPVTHTWEFSDRHGSEATARPASCEGCHVRPSCLECHRPDPARGSGGSSYHPSGFLTSHPTAAYSRQVSCADCHNTAQFCQDCHRVSGLTALRRLGLSGYHDAFRGFSLGHGQAARRNLESCVSCHVERDCTSCHSAIGGGFRFNPHGPGFDAERLRRKNPSMCTACHGLAIPNPGDDR